MSAPASYLVLGCKSWNEEVFNEVLRSYPGSWRYVGKPEDLILSQVEAFDPQYLFFLHWSWRVPEELLERYTCVGFHMTDLPFGRGGSPLQNLIEGGHHKTLLTAFRMTQQMDAGPIYLKEPLELEGSAQEIYIRATRLSAKMIHRIIHGHFKERPQVGRPTSFKRRTPKQSQIPRLDSLERLYDFIRMLDAEGYPRAFLEHGGFTFTFDQAEVSGGRLTARASIERCSLDQPRKSEPTVEEVLT